MGRSKIAVAGSYAVGLTMKTDRFPSSGETLLGYDFACMHGGKGSNQAIACARQGAFVSLIASIGNDNYGQSALKLWEQEKISTKHVRISEQAPTGVGFIMVDSRGSNEIIIDLGANKELDASCVRRSYEAIAASDLLLMQLEIPLEAVGEAVRIAGENQVFSILNPAPWQPVPDQILRKCSLLTPNETEAKLMLGFSADAEVELDVLADRLLEKGIRQAVITLGEKGSYLAAPHCREHLAAFSVPAVDTTGAGDTFTAALGTALADKADLKEAVLYASAASAVTVTGYGVVEAMPDRGQIEEFLEAHKDRVKHCMKK